MGIDGKNEFLYNTNVAKGERRELGGAKKMLEKISKMKIAKRLNTGYLIVIAMMVISGMISMAALGTLYYQFNDFANRVNVADTATKMIRIEINIGARNVREMVIDQNVANHEVYLERVENAVTELKLQLATLKETDVVDNELYGRLETNVLGWEEIGYSVIDDIQAGDTAAAHNAILNQCAPALQETLEIAREIDAITNASMENSIKICAVSAIIGVIAIIVFAVIATVMAVKIGKQIVNSIIEPLKQIEAVTGELTAGNLHSNLEYRSDDEIGHLAHDLRKAIRILGSYVDDINDFMVKFSAGDFTVDALVEWKGDFEAIHTAFMSFEDEMSETVKGIQAVANQVSGGSEQVAASANDLAEGASEQAGITEELAATVISVSERVQQNAEEAKEISKGVENVGIEIVNSNEKMKEMVASMTEINEASAKISRIIATINDIASQTNLLALNASIEAARAGEAGKGFAVVADQVSLLAAQSAEAAKESTALIQASMDAVEKGMVIAEETAQQLEQVLEGSKVITQEVNGVAAVLEEQAQSMNQINIGIEQINDVVQTNSATSEECAAASQEMSGQAENLENLISRFVVR